MDMKTRRKSLTLALSVLLLCSISFSIYLLTEKAATAQQVQSFHQSKFNYAISALANSADDLQHNHLVEAEVQLRVAAEDLRLLGDDYNYGRTQTHVSTLLMSHLIELYAQEIHEWEVDPSSAPPNKKIVQSDLQTLERQAIEEKWGQLNYDSFQKEWNAAVAQLQDQQVTRAYELDSGLAK